MSAVVEESVPALPGILAIFAADATSAIGNISDQITLSDTIELDYSYANDSDMDKIAFIH